MEDLVDDSQVGQHPGEHRERPDHREEMGAERHLRAGAGGRPEAGLTAGEVEELTAREDIEPGVLSGNPDEEVPRHADGVEGGEPVQVTTDLSFNPAVSPDGSLLAYDDSSKLVIAPSAGGQPIKTFKPRGGMYQWVPGRQMLSYLSAETGVTNIWVQSPYGGESQQLLDFKSYDPVLAYAWSRDAKQLAVARGNPTSDVILVSEIK